MRFLWLIVLLLLAGCQKHEPISGVIAGKILEPAHDEDSTYPMIVGKTTIFMPSTDHISDRYWFKVRRVKVEIVKVQVNKRDFESYKTGDFFKEE